MNNFIIFEKDFKERLKTLIKYYNSNITDEILKIRILEIMLIIEGKDATT